MNIPTRISSHGKKSLLILPMLLGIQALPLSSAEYVWSNPTLQTNTASIYTAGKITDASNASTRASVLGSNDFGAVQVWADTGTDWLAGSATVNGLSVNNGIMAFSSNLRSDVRFSFSGTPSTSAGSQLTNSSFLSSSGSAMRVIPGSASDPVSTTLTIDFGSWQNSTFNSSVNAVSAAGFTLSTSDNGRWGGVESLVVTFRDSNNDVLSTQGIPAGFPTISGSSSLFFGYNSGINNISSIQVVLEGTTNQLFGFDEFGFSAIPEPSSTTAALVGLALLLAACRRFAKRSGPRSQP